MSFHSQALYMITNVPTAEEYSKTGLDLLNLAWGQIADLSQTLDLSDEDNSSHETKEETQERHRLFWQASNQKIANSLVIVQQATEFLLKAKIAAVSPAHFSRRRLLCDEFFRILETGCSESLCIL
jgi:hypothetical protein